MSSPCIIVHGGAYAIADAKAAALIAGCENAARVGYAILAAGGSALDAVEAAINCLENDPTFDAGYGSDLNSAGFVEMDAMIMNGSNLSCGSVAGIRSVRNPISVARKVMEETNHVLLVGEGADIFAREQGFPYVGTEELISPNARDVLAEYQSYHNAVNLWHLQFTSSADPSKDRPAAHPHAPDSHDTVGCVALCTEGILAVGTSTGGIAAKKVGRVGDSPIIGCGGYVDNVIGGASTTGHGESIMKVTLARLALWLHETKAAQSLQAAAEKALEIMKERTSGCGGIIMIDKEGNIAHACTTPRMCWSSIDHTGTQISGIE